MITPAKLQNLIHEFLYDKRKSNGDGYAEITLGDVQYLYEIISMLVELKFEPDADGDYPIDYEITDLTRYERSLFLQVPRWGGEADDNNYDDILRAYAINNNIAADKVKIFANVFCSRIVREKIKHNLGTK